MYRNFIEYYVKKLVGFRLDIYKNVYCELAKFDFIDDNLLLDFLLFINDEYEISFQVFLEKNEIENNNYILMNKVIAQNIYECVINYFENKYKGE